MIDQNMATVQQDMFAFLVQNNGIIYILEETSSKFQKILKKYVSWNTALQKLLIRAVVTNISRNKVNNFISYSNWAFVWTRQAILVICP